MNGPKIPLQYIHHQNGEIKAKKKKVIGLKTNGLKMWELQTIKNNKNLVWNFKIWAEFTAWKKPWTENDAYQLKLWYAGIMNRISSQKKESESSTLYE